MDVKTTSISKNQIIDREQCIWTEIKFRCILGISLMHFMLFLLMMMRNQTSKILNEGAWLSKIAFIIIMDILFIYAIPNSIVSSIHSFSVYLSLFWWFIQVVINLLRTLSLLTLFMLLMSESKSWHNRMRGYPQSRQF